MNEATSEEIIYLYTLSFGNSKKKKSTLFKREDKAPFKRSHKAKGKSCQRNCLECYFRIEFHVHMYSKKVDYSLLQLS